jgi:Zn-dependent peptidase ImmA (M78 family)
MNSVTREAILRGIGGAAEIHDAFRFRDTHDNGLRPIDVFGLIQELQIPLEFKALDDLLGACVRVSSAEVGILLTTRRDLHMQRFTAAHELGHFVLEHEGSLDREVRLPGNTAGRDPREIEADAFAAEFLMPKWLVKAAATRRDWWSADSLQDPDTVYQLSLRLAASYEAICWGLVSHEYIARETAESLVGNGKRLKEVKRKALREVTLEDSWADVWVLGAGDDGALLDAGAHDIFIFDLEERPSTGFRWDVRDAAAQGFDLLDDTSTFDPTVVGGPARRRLVFRAPPAGTYDLRLPLSRSFARTTGPRTLSVAISTVGTRRGDEDSRGAAAPATTH